MFYIQSKFYMYSQIIPDLVQRLFSSRLFLKILWFNYNLLLFDRGF